MELGEGVKRSRTILAWLGLESGRNDVSDASCGAGIGAEGTGAARPLPLLLPLEGAAGGDLGTEDEDGPAFGGGGVTGEGPAGARGVTGLGGTGVEGVEGEVGAGSTGCEGV